MYSIAFIEDSPTDVRLLRMALDKAGLSYNYRQLVDGHASLRSLLETSDPPDLIIADAYLPGIVLGELIDNLKQSVRLKSVPIVVLSGSSDPGLVEGALTRGAADFFNKPHDLEGWFTLGKRLKLLVETLAR